MRDVRAVMCDIDGTLLTSGHSCAPSTIEAIRALREHGILFGLCTGRDVVGVEALLDTWGLAGLVDVIVGCGGAEVRDYRHDVFENHFPLAGDAIREVMAHFEDMPVSFVVPVRGVLYTPVDDARVQRLSQVDRLPYRVVDFDAFLTEPRPKLMLACAPEDMDAVVARAATFASDRYTSASLITSARLYEYMDPRISKPYGIARVAELNGFTLQEVCAFGDADNDAAMVREVGLGVAMGNGSEKTKAAADFVTLDNDSNGIAVFLRDHLFDVAS